MAILCVTLFALALSLKSKDAEQDLAVSAAPPERGPQPDLQQANKQAA